MFDRNWPPTPPPFSWNFKILVNCLVFSRLKMSQKHTEKYCHHKPLYKPSIYVDAYLYTCTFIVFKRYRIMGIEITKGFCEIAHPEVQRVSHRIHWRQGSKGSLNRLSKVFSPVLWIRQFSSMQIRIQAKT